MTLPHDDTHLFRRLISGSNSGINREPQGDGETRKRREGKGEKERKGEEKRRERERA